MERLKTVLNIAKIIIDIVLIALLVLFLKEYRESTLSQIEEGCPS